MLSLRIKSEGFLIISLFLTGVQFYVLITEHSKLLEISRNINRQVEDNVEGITWLTTCFLFVTNVSSFVMNFEIFLYAFGDGFGVGIFVQFLAVVIQLRKYVELNLKVIA